MKILVINCGSSSLKFQLIDMDKEDRIVKGNFERIGGKRSNIRLNVRGNKSNVPRIARDFEEAIISVLNLLQDPNYNIIKSLVDVIIKIFTNYEEYTTRKIYLSKWI